MTSCPSITERRARLCRVLLLILALITSLNAELPSCFADPVNPAQPKDEEPLVAEGVGVVSAGNLWESRVKGTPTTTIYHDKVPLSFSPTDSTLAMIDESGLVLKDVATGKTVKTLALEGGLNKTWVFQHSPNGKLLALLAMHGPSKQIHLLDVATGETQRTIDADLDGPISLRFSDNRILACGRKFGMWNADTGESLLSVDAPFWGHPTVGKSYGQFFDCTKSRLAVGSNGIVTICDKATGKVILQHRMELRFPRYVMISPNERFVAVYAGTSQFEPASGPPMVLIDIEKPSRTASFDGHVIQLLFANNDQLLTLDHEGAISVWSVPELKKQRTLGVDSDSIRAIALMPKTDLLAVGDEKGFQLFDWKRNKPVKGSRREYRNVYFLKPSPDGKYLASCIGSGVLIMWDVAKLTAK